MVVFIPPNIINKVQALINKYHGNVAAGGLAMPNITILSVSYANSNYQLVVSKGLYVCWSILMYPFY